jgi:hypothetical protein
VVLENTEKDYYVTGQFAGWGDAVGKDQFRMTAVSLKDARVAALKADLKGAKYLYILENVVISDTGAGWTAQYVEGGVVKECDGNQTMKWLQTGGHRVLKAEKSRILHQTFFGSQDSLKPLKLAQTGTETL